MATRRPMLRYVSAGLATVLATVVLSLVATPASAATSDECTKSINVVRLGENLAVPANPNGSTACNIGRDEAANSTIVRALQLTLKQCFPAVHIAGSTSLVGSLDVDGSFGPITEAAMKGVQKAIGVSQDGIYGPITRTQMLFRSNDLANRCFPWM